MKLYGITNKRALGNYCPCCGPWKNDARGRKKRARQAARKEIEREHRQKDA